MKKFLIGTSVILAAIIAVIVSLACIKPKYDLNYTGAATVIVFEKSLTAKKKGETDTFSNESQVYKDIMYLIDKSLSTSLLNLLFHRKSAKPVIEQDLSGTAQTLDTTTKQETYRFELNYSEAKNQIVYYKGDAKLVTAGGYYGLMFVLGREKGIQEINIFFKTSSVGSYQANPMKITIDNTKLIEYIENM